MQQKKQKIVFIVNSLNIGGTEKIVIETCNGLDFTKYDATIVCLSPYDSANSIYTVVAPVKEINIVYFSYDFGSDYSLSGYFKLLLKKSTDSSLKPIIDYLVKLQPDIIHFHTSPRELIIANRLKQKNKKIFTDHSLRIRANEYGKIKTHLLIFVLKRLYSKFNVITVSEDIKRNLCQLNIFNHKRNITVIPNSIDTNLYEPSTSKKTEQLAVIYVSRIAEGKGHKDLIKAWGLLKNIPEKKLMIVGPDNLNGEIHQLVERYNCSDSVEFAGAVSDSKDWLIKANIAVFPSYKEGLPLSLLEKMAMQLPVVAYNIKELAAIITDKHTGLLIKPGDYVSLSEKISFLYNHKELREQIGRNARLHVIKQHHLGNTQKEIEKFYQGATLS